MLTTISNIHHSELPKMDTLICEEHGSKWHLRNSGMGGFLDPPGYATHNFSIVEIVRTREAGFYSLNCSESWLPEPVKKVISETLKENPGEVTEEWIRQVYAHLRHCYSKDGINRNAGDCAVYGKFWGNADKEAEANPEYHLGYLFVKKFDTSHKPRVDLF